MRNFSGDNKALNAVIQSVAIEAAATASAEQSNSLTSAADVS